VRRSEAGVISDAFRIFLCWRSLPNCIKQQTPPWNWSLLLDSSLKGLHINKFIKEFSSNDLLKYSANGFNQRRVCESINQWRSQSNMKFDIPWNQTPISMMSSERCLESYLLDWLCIACWCYCFHTETS